MNKEEIIKGLESVKKECGMHLDEGFAWICEPIDGAIELIKALEQQPSDDCVSRQVIIDSIDSIRKHHGGMLDVRLVVTQLSPVTPVHGTCKDCKHWKDSDGVYRRGIGAESKCPINNSRVFEGTFYCADFEKRGNEND